MNRRQQFLDDILNINPNYDVDLINKAYSIAEDMHNGQLRKSGEPYIIHPIEVARILAELGMDDETLVAGLLHDVIEDTPYTKEQLKAEFGEEVLLLVDGVTKLGSIVFENKEEKQAENLRKMFLAMSKDIRVLIIKLADRLHNLRTINYMTEEKIKEKCRETLEIYAPLASRLGIYTMKFEMEDIALKYLEPEAYYELAEKVSARKGEREAVINQVIAEVKKALDDFNIKCEIMGRSKHFYSIYRKMYAQSKTMDEVFDLFAFRVIVDTVADCYNVLGVIHDLYRPVLGRFKDYIGTPKPNGYQSLHTTVMGPDGVMFEVQIRTQEMHDIAEYGIAAHWKYKQGISGSANEQNYEWVRRLLENQENTDAEEFIHTLKVDMFADEVFVFTPNGDVINLPAGATPIDFAYTIHSAVGNHMVGAKVNGRIVQFDYHLRNGDVVEVMTSNSAHGPSRDWVKIARSSNARSKIRQWFKKEKRDENIVNGRQSFESELKRTGVTLKELTNEDVLPGVLRKLCYNSLDDMYAAIGYGGISALKVIGRLREDIQRILHQHQADRQAEVPVADQPHVMRPAVPQRAKSEQGIVVEGLTNCLVKFSKCCTPVPGDDIVGFITRGYGISVHRADCPNADPARRKPSEAGRWIKVSWGSDTEESYRTTLEVTAKDRINLIMDVSTILSSTKTHVSSMNARSTPDGFALLSLDIDVPNNEQLRTVMRRIEQISGVMRVTRPAG